MEMKVALLFVVLFGMVAISSGSRRHFFGSQAEMKSALKKNEEQLNMMEKLDTQEKLEEQEQVKIQDRVQAQDLLSKKVCSICSPHAQSMNSSDDLQGYINLINQLEEEITYINTIEEYLNYMTEVEEYLNNIEYSMPNFYQIPDQFNFKNQFTELKHIVQVVLENIVDFLFPGYKKMICQVCNLISIVPPGLPTFLPSLINDKN